MAKYQYSKHLTRAFWNSLLAVLSALVLASIIVLLWNEIKSIANSIITNDDEEVVEAQDDELKFLESLRSSDSTPTEEESALILEELRSDDGSDMDEEETSSLLESLRGS